MTLFSVHILTLSLCSILCRDFILKLFFSPFLYWSIFFSPTPRSILHLDIEIPHSSIFLFLSFCLGGFLKILYHIQLQLWPLGWCPPHQCHKLWPLLCREWSIWGLWLHGAHNIYRSVPLKPPVSRQPACTSSNTDVTSLRTIRWRNWKMTNLSFCNQEADVHRSLATCPCRKFSIELGSE